MTKIQINTFFFIVLSLIQISNSSTFANPLEPEFIPSELTSYEWNSIKSQINKSTKLEKVSNTINLQQTDYIKASNTGTGDRFGVSVSISGDTLAVGSYKESSNSTGVNGEEGNDLAVESGAVYVFIRENGEWSQQAYIKASNTDAGDYFGGSVSLSGDTLAIGAYKEDSSAKGINGNEEDNLAEDSGAVYIFSRTNNIWTQQVYIKSSNSETNDRFGVSVSLTGNTLAVGAYFEDSNAKVINGDEENNLAENSGAAYVFTRSNGIWSQEAYLKASNSESDDVFGINIASSDNKIIVGAINEDSNATGVNGDQDNNDAADSGAAYVFYRTNGLWTQNAYLKASNTDSGDSFGESPAISNNMIVVGAWLEDSIATGVNGNQADNSGFNTGAAYVFTLIDDSWSQEAYLKASTIETGGIDIDGFGYSVDLFENNLVIGAFWEDSDSTGVNGDESNQLAAKSGAAYIFKRINNNWSQQAYLKASNTNADYWFSNSVAISNDTLVCGSIYESSGSFGINGDESDSSASKAGAVYMFNYVSDMIFVNEFE